MTTRDPDDMSRTVKALAREVGFVGVGVTTPDTGADGRRLRDWLDRGRHGTMAWMERTAALRIDPTRRLPGCRAVVALSLPYDRPRPLSTEVPPDPDRAWISRHAWGDDYHHVMRAMLRRLTDAIHATFGADVGVVSHVDSGPVLERSHAARAGLGWIGKNTCLIDPERGSFVFLAALLTDLPLALDEASVPDLCGACERCLRACPTGALVAPRELDARRCVSYLTIESRDPIPPDLRPGVGCNVFGCDICQDVCPWNRRARARGVFGPERFGPRDGLFHPRRDDLAALRRGEFRRLFRASTVLRRGRAGLQETVAAVGAGQDGDGSDIAADRAPREGAGDHDETS